MAEDYIKGTGIGRGGWRGGGRKKGVKIGKLKPDMINFHRRVTPEEKEYLEKCLADFRNKKEG